MHSLRSAVLAAAALVALAAPAAAQEVFAVQGSNPGSNKVDYTGLVAVAKTGATWQFEWRVGGDPIRGTGILMDNTHMAAAGIVNGKPFVFMLKKDGERFIGLWTTAGSNLVGREVWTPK